MNSDIQLADMSVYKNCQNLSQNKFFWISIYKGIEMCLKKVGKNQLQKHML